VIVQCVLRGKETQDLSTPHSLPQAAGNAPVEMTDLEKMAASVERHFVDFVLQGTLDRMWDGNFRREIEASASAL